MTIRADYTPGFFRRFLWIAIGCGAFVLWCFYDALVKYPGQLERAEIYWELDEETRYDQWRALTKEKRWPSAAPLRPEEIQHKIDSQYFFAALALLAGVPCLIKWFTARGSWVEATEQGLTTSWGPQLNFDSIISIDKTKWADKGIAKIQFRDGDRQRTFVLDDFKFDRQQMDQILRIVESQLKDDQFIGGTREPDAEAESDADPTLVETSQDTSST